MQNHRKGSQKSPARPRIGSLVPQEREEGNSPTGDATIIIHGVLHPYRSNTLVSTDQGQLSLLRRPLSLYSWEASRSRAAPVPHADEILPATHLLPKSCLCMFSTCMLEWTQHLFGAAPAALSVATVFGPSHEWITREAHPCWTSLNLMVQPCPWMIDQCSMACNSGLRDL